MVTSLRFYTGVCLIYARINNIFVNSLNLFNTSFEQSESYSYSHVAKNPKYNRTRCFWHYEESTRFERKKLPKQLSHINTSSSNLSSFADHLFKTALIAICIKLKSLSLQNRYMIPLINVLSFKAVTFFNFMYVEVIFISTPFFP